jgi:hypothetical protein
VVKAASSLSFVLPTDYYGNPVDDQGLLVTIELGEDSCQASSRATGVTAEVYGINDMTRVIRFIFIVVFVSRNPAVLRQLVICD